MRPFFIDFTLVANTSEFVGSGALLWYFCTIIYRFKTYSMSQFLRISSLFLVLSTIVLLSSCGKEGAPGGGSTSTTPVYDTATQGSPVTESANKFIYLRPPVGEVFRYRLQIVSSGSAQHIDSLFKQYPPNEKLAVTTTIYLRHTIRQIRQDSSVDIAFRFDTIMTVTDANGKKTDLSTARESDLKDPMFNNASAIAGKDLGAIVTRNGDVVELYGTTAILAKYMSQLPDSLKTPQTQTRLNQQIQTTISEYLQKTLTHFPSKALAKDTAWGGMVTQNTPVWQNVLYPTAVESREFVRGFEERGGKVLVVFDATTTVKPSQSVMDQGNAKTTLNNFDLVTKASSHVEAETGVLVYRKITQDRATNFQIQSKTAANQHYQIISKANETTTVQLLQ